MSKEMPAWLICEDMITRIKDELILEAIDILHEEIRAKRIDIQGYTSLLPDKSDELQRDMYIINNLLLGEQEIREQYNGYIGGNPNPREPEIMERMEQLKKFLLAVDAISMLMGFSGELAQWAEDTGNFHQSKDIADVTAKSMEMHEPRRSILEYVTKSKKFRKSEALSASEMETLEKTLRPKSK